MRFGAKTGAARLADRVG